MSLSKNEGRVLKKKRVTVAKTGLKIEFGSPNQRFRPRDVDLVMRFFYISLSHGSVVHYRGELLFPPRDVFAEIFHCFGGKSPFKVTM